MRRLAALGLLLVAAMSMALLVASHSEFRDRLRTVPGLGFFGVREQPPNAYRVDAIFDSAKGVIPGQLVKVAGVRVGIVKDVKLTGDYKARFELEVDGRFAPFRSDASCEIQPEGLTAENFVQCDPGSPRGTALRSAGGHPPTLAVSRTSTPVNLTALFDIWSLPARERLRVLINELGLGLAGRGDDVNELLRRTNPSLQQARRAISILNRQRRQLVTIVDSTDRVVAELARRRGRVKEFIGEAARVTTQTAQHSGELGESVRRLPRLLAVSKPALQRADEFALAATPLFDRLHASAPSLNRALRDLGPFAVTSMRPLRGLRATVHKGIGVTRRARPLARAQRRFTPVIRPVARQVNQQFVNLRDRGFIEGGLSVFYALAAGTSRFDSISHILPAHLIVNDCARYATTPIAGCDAHYRGHVTSSRRGRRADRSPTRASQPGRPPATAVIPRAPPRPPRPHRRHGLLPLAPPRDALPSGGSSRGDRNIDLLLDYLLG